MKGKAILFVCITCFLFPALPCLSDGFELVDDNNLKLTMGLRFAFLGDFEIPENITDITINSTQIALKGELYNWLDFKLSCDTVIPDEDTHEYSFLLEDLYIQHAFHDYLYLRLGQFKVPFGEEIFYSLGERPYIERTETTKNITPGRDLGIMVSGKNILTLMGYNLGIFHGTGPDLPGETENTFLGAGKVYARYKGSGFFDIKLGYNAYYHRYFLDVLHHNLAQGFFAKASLRFDKKNEVSILTEYQERLRLLNVANQNMDWQRGIIMALSYRYSIIEPLILLEWYNDSLLYEDDNDLFLLKTGITGYFMKKDLIRIKLLYELEYPYHSDVLSHKLSALIQLEF